MYIVKIETQTVAGIATTVECKAGNARDLAHLRRNLSLASDVAWARATVFHLGKEVSAEILKDTLRCVAFEVEVVNPTARQDRLAHWCNAYGVWVTLSNGAQVYYPRSANGRTVWCGHVAGGDERPSVILPEGAPVEPCVPMPMPDPGSEAGRAYWAAVGAWRSLRDEVAAVADATMRARASEAQAIYEAARRAVA